MLDTKASMVLEIDIFFNLYDFNNNLIKEIIMPQGFSLSDPYQFSDDYETLACVDTNEDSLSGR